MRELTTNEIEEVSGGGFGEGITYPGGPTLFEDVQDAVDIIVEVLAYIF